ncbi:MAG: DUF433 domain-containing protein [Phycisphaeraceae bacterium]|nr:MAG: DUF433 domain-containing protein [Phycisphaeraceae bacterium]
MPQDAFPRIESNPEILGGKPCVKGTRLSVEFILELAAGGASRDDIVKAYPQLKPEDVEQAMLYAARVLKNDVIVNTRIAG